MTDECDKWYVVAYHSLPYILLTPNNSLPSTRPPGSTAHEYFQHRRSLNLVEYGRVPGKRVDRSWGAERVGG